MNIAPQRIINIAPHAERRQFLEYYPVRSWRKEAIGSAVLIFGALAAYRSKTRLWRYSSAFVALLGLRAVYLGCSQRVERSRKIQERLVDPLASQLSNDGLEARFREWVTPLFDKPIPLRNSDRIVRSILATFKAGELKTATDFALFFFLLPQDQFTPDLLRPLISEELRSDKKFLTDWASFKCWLSPHPALFADLPAEALWKDLDFVISWIRSFPKSERDPQDFLPRLRGLSFANKEQLLQMIELFPEERRNSAEWKEFVQQGWWSYPLFLCGWATCFASRESSQALNEQVPKELWQNIGFVIRWVSSLPMDKRNPDEFLPKIQKISASGDDLRRLIDLFPQDRRLPTDWNELVPPDVWKDGQFVYHWLAKFPRELRTAENFGDQLRYQKYSIESTARILSRFADGSKDPNFFFSLTREEEWKNLPDTVQVLSEWISEFPDRIISHHNFLSLIEITMGTGFEGLVKWVEAIASTKETIAPYKADCLEWFHSLDPQGNREPIALVRSVPQQMREPNDWLSIVPAEDWKSPDRVLEWAELFRRAKRQLSHFLDPMDPTLLKDRPFCIRFLRLFSPSQKKFWFSLEQKKLHKLTDNPDQLMALLSALPQDMWDLDSILPLIPEEAWACGESVCRWVEVIPEELRDPKRINPHVDAKLWADTLFWKEYLGHFSEDRLRLADFLSVLPLEPNSYEDCQALYERMVPLIRSEQECVKFIIELADAWHRRHVETPLKTHERIKQYIEQIPDPLVAAFYDWTKDRIVSHLSGDRAAHIFIRGFIQSHPNGVDQADMPDLQRCLDGYLFAHACTEHIANSDRIALQLRSNNSMAELNTSLECYLTEYGYHPACQRIAETLREAHRNKSTSLTISNTGLKELPLKALACLDHLTRLDLSHNEIDSLPYEFGKLQNLQYLDIRGTKVRWIPYELKGRPNLKILMDNS